MKSIKSGASLQCNSPVRGATFVDAIDSSTAPPSPYDLRFFQSLDRAVQIEPWLARDKLMIDMLKSIGFEKGKPFNPDAKTRDILT